MIYKNKNACSNEKIQQELVEWCSQSFTWSGNKGEDWRRAPLQRYKMNVSSVHQLIPVDVAFKIWRSCFQKVSSEKGTYVPQKSRLRYMTHIFCALVFWDHICRTRRAMARIKERCDQAKCMPSLHPTFEVNMISIGVKDDSVQRLTLVDNWTVKRGNDAANIKVIPIPKEESTER
jgi:hypothetical protein